MLRQRFGGGANTAFEDEVIEQIVTPALEGVEKVASTTVMLTGGVRVVLRDGRAFRLLVVDDG